MQDNKLHIRLLKYLDGENVSEQEKTEILQWIEENQDNKQYADLIKKLSSEKKYFNQLKTIDLDHHLDRFRNNIRKNVSEQKFRKITLYRIAAAILILILASSTVYFAYFMDAGQIQQVSSLQENTEVLLSDGTGIILNKGSVLNYPKKLNTRSREVSLKGEAFFDVAKKTGIPFNVYLDKTTIRVLGTSFNIKEDEQGLVEVSVLTGKVVFFEKENSENAIELEAGQKGIFNTTSSEFEKTIFDSENFLYWKTGTLTFNEQPLASVFEILERSYGITIIVNDKDILQNRLTSRCEGQQLDDILGELSILFAIHYEIKGDTAYIQKGP